MEQEKIEEEMKRVREIFGKLDPTSEKYSTAVKNYLDLEKAFSGLIETHESELDHSHKRDCDEVKLEQSEKEEKNRVKLAILEHISGFVKTFTAGGIAIAGIIVAGAIEESSILNPKLIKFVQGFMPVVR